MAKMKVIRDKPVRYPVSGPEGKEYKRGEEFTIPPGPYEERDVKALTLIRAAEVVDEKSAAKLSYSTRAMTEESAEAPLVEPATPRAYRRRDMKAEG